MVRKTPESYVLSACKDYLEIKGWTVRRMQSGAVQDRRGVPVRMHAAGTPDLQATKQVCDYLPPLAVHWIVWVETKAGNGTQSPLQKQFEADAKDRGEMYVLAYSIEDLELAGL
jgi:hypothetical protein